MTNKRLALIVLVATLGLTAMASPVRSQDSTDKSASPAVDGKLYELRIYTTNPGKLPDLHRRFRDHTMRLFEKHGMENIIYWNVVEGTPDEADIKDNLLVYIIAHQDEASREASWQAFINDPEWKEVAAQSEQNGKILAKAPDSILMRETDFSAPDAPLNRDTDSPPRLFELRNYIDGPDRVPHTVDRFASGEKDIFTKHGMETVKFWTSDDNSAFIYLLAHQDRESARESWKGFMPDFREFMQKYNAEREQPPRSASSNDPSAPRRRVEVRFLIPTDYSPRK